MIPEAGSLRERKNRSPDPNMVFLIPFSGDLPSFPARNGPYASRWTHIVCRKDDLIIVSIIYQREDKSFNIISRFFIHKPGHIFLFVLVTSTIDEIECLCEYLPFSLV
jgi:hypothetical protein